MIIQRVNRTNPEKAFIVCRNDTAVTIGKGYPADFVFDGTRDGLDLTDTNTGTAAKTTLLAGLCDSAIAASQYGLVQCYGVRTDAPVFQTDTAYAIGDALVLMTASSIMSRVGAGAVSAYLPGIVCGAVVATSSAAAINTGGVVFLRLM